MSPIEIQAQSVWRAAHVARTTSDPGILYGALTHLFVVATSSHNERLRRYTFRLYEAICETDELRPQAYRRGLAQREG